MVLNQRERLETYISISCITAAASVFAGALLFESRPYHRIALSSAAIALSTGGIICHNTRGKEARRYNQLAINSQWEKALILSEHSLEDLYKRLHPRAAAEFAEAEIVEPEALPASDDTYYNWENLPDDASGIIVAGGTGYGKSSVAKWILGLFTKTTAATIRLYDGHGIENDWENLGLQAITDFSLIETGLQETERELDRRREDKTRREPWIVVCDELGASFDNFKNPKRIQKILRRLGSEGRKFGITAILINQSDNCSALGIDSKYRANFTTIFLGEIAREIFKKGTPERELLDASAYPCCVGGNIPKKTAIHPTHGDYSQFKKKGNAPQNLLPINQLPHSKPTINLEKAQPKPEPVEAALERVYNNDEELPANILTQAEWELYGIALGTDYLSVREAQRSPVARRQGWNSEKIKEIFHRFCELGLGCVVPRANGTLEFFPNED